MPITGPVSIPSHVIGEAVGEEFVLLDTDRGSFFTLNATGARFWDLLLTHRQLGAAREALLREFAVTPDDLDRDLEQLVAELVELGLLDLV